MNDDLGPTLTTRLDEENVGTASRTRDRGPSLIDPA